MKTMLGGQKGLTFVGIIVFLAIFGVIYIGYLYVPVIINYYVAKEVIQKAANMAFSERNDQLIIDDCERRLQHAELPVTPGVCTIERGPSNDWSLVKYTYNVTVKFVPTQYERQHKFDLWIKQDLTPNMRGGR
jgi:hypothetical protein